MLRMVSSWTASGIFDLISVYMNVGCGPSAWSSTG